MKLLDRNKVLDLCSVRQGLHGVEDVLALPQGLLLQSSLSEGALSEAQAALHGQVA